MPVEKALPDHQLNNVLRWCKTVSLDRLKTFQVVVDEAMVRLRLTPDPSKAVPGLVAGSDVFDSGSIKTWLSMLNPGRRADREAKAQVVQIHATLMTRMG